MGGEEGIGRGSQTLPSNETLPRCQPPSQGSLVSHPVPPPGCPAPDPAPEPPRPHGEAGSEWACWEEGWQEASGPFCSQLPGWCQAPADRTRAGPGGRLVVTVATWGRGEGGKGPDGTTRTVFGRMPARSRSGARGCSALPQLFSLVLLVFTNQRHADCPEVKIRKKKKNHPKSLNAAEEAIPAWPLQAIPHRKKSRELCPQQSCPPWGQSLGPVPRGSFRPGSLASPTAVHFWVPSP